MEKLIVFLGNPGFKYKNTRHNSGWLISDYMFPSVNWSTKFNGLYYTENDNIFLKPQTYMNLSGDSVQKASFFFKILPKDIIIVHDDIEKPFGSLLFEKGGGLRGHNGLKSIKQQLNTGDFYRLRFGVGRPKFGDVASFVLQPFTNDEKIELPSLLEKSKMLINQFLSEEKI